MLSAVRRRLALAARADEVELLDAGGLSSSEVRANLLDLARLNRLPGGTRASVAAVRHLTGGGAGIRILDVGTGAGDIPVAFASRGWPTVAIDTNPEVLRVARAITADAPLVEVLDADGGALPFEDGSFDVAHCSLLAHHLDPAEAVAVFRELRRVARRGIVVNDLRRGLLPLAATAAGIAVLARSRVTWNDGIISSRRSYTVAELDDLLHRAGLAVAWRSPGWLPRVATAAVAR